MAIACLPMTTDQNALPRMSRTSGQSPLTTGRNEPTSIAQPPGRFLALRAETIAVIDYNGDVRACELREKFGTLADYDYDFGALWAADGRQTELNAIDGGKA